MPQLLINKKQMKQFALDAAQNRAHFKGKKVRVAESFYNHFDALLRRAIVNCIAQYPSKGVTLK